MNKAKQLRKLGTCCILCSSHLHIHHLILPPLPLACNFSYYKSLKIEKEIVDVEFLNPNLPGLSYSRNLQ